MTIHENGDCYVSSTAALQHGREQGDEVRASAMRTGGMTPYAEGVLRGLDIMREYLQSVAT